MIDIDALSMQRRTYRRLIGKLTEDQIEKLANLQKYVVKSITEAVYTGNWYVEDIRIDDFELLQIIIAELQMKGFKAKYVTLYEVAKLKNEVIRNNYYTLNIKWELEN